MPVNAPGVLIRSVGSVITIMAETKGRSSGVNGWKDESMIYSNEYAILYKMNAS